MYSHAEAFLITFFVNILWNFNIAFFNFSGIPTAEGSTITWFGVKDPSIGLALLFIRKVIPGYSSDTGHRPST